MMVECAHCNEAIEEKYKTIFFNPHKKFSCPRCDRNFKIKFPLPMMIIIGFMTVITAVCVLILRKMHLNFLYIDSVRKQHRLIA